MMTKDNEDSLLRSVALQNASSIRIARHHAEQRQEAYLAEAHRLTHSGSGVWRMEGREAVHLAGEWYRIYGFAPDRGMPGWEARLQRVHAEDRAKSRGIIDPAIRDKSDYQEEFRIVLPDGTVKY